MDQSISKNKEEYKRSINYWPNIPLFFQPWYLDVVCQSEGRNRYWDVSLSRNKEGQIQGVLPYFMSSRYGLSHSTMPQLTPYLGPWIIYPVEGLKKSSTYRYEKKVLIDLIDQLPKSILTKIHTHLGIKNILPFVWKGFEAHIRYTFCLKKNTEEQLWANLDSKQRNIIKGAKEKFVIHQSGDVETFYKLNKMSFSRSGDRIPYSFSYLSSLDKVLKQHGAHTILFAKDDQNNIHSGIYLVHDQLSSYCLALGNNPKFKNSGALPLLVWNSILRSFENAETYNFEGGMIPNIEQFFRSFGGEMMTYYRLQKVKNQLVKAFLVLINKI